MCSRGKRQSDGQERGLCSGPVCAGCTRRPSLPSHAPRPASPPPCCGGAAVWSLQPPSASPVDRVGRVGREGLSEQRPPDPARSSCRSSLRPDDLRGSPTCSLPAGAVARATQLPASPLTAVPAGLPLLRTAGWLKRPSLRAGGQETGVWSGASLRPGSWSRVFWPQEGESQVWAPGPEQTPRPAGTGFWGALAAWPDAGTVSAPPVTPPPVTLQSCLQWVPLLLPPLSPEW